MPSYVLTFLRNSRDLIRRSFHNEKVQEGREHWRWEFQQNNLIKSWFLINPVFIIVLTFLLQLATFHSPLYHKDSKLSVQSQWLTSGRRNLITLWNKLVRIPLQIQGSFTYRTLLPSQLSSWVEWMVHSIIYRNWYFSAGNR